MVVEALTTEDTEKALKSVNHGGARGTRGETAFIPVFPVFPVLPVVNLFGFSVSSVVNASHKEPAMNPVSALLLLVAMLAPVSVLAGDATQRLHAFFSEVHTLSADFDQTVLDPNHRQIQSAQGRLYLQRPGRFRWDYTTPYKQLLVGDGKKVWFYDTELEQVTVKNQGAALGGSPALLLSGDRPLEQSFKITERGTQDGLDWLELSPKTKDTEFSSVRLGFRGDALEAMELTDGFGQTTHLHFTHERRNPPLDNALFKFDPPEGVDVVGDQ